MNAGTYVRTLHFPTSPKSSDWRCRLTPGPHGLILQPAEGDVPNAFHRWVQRICFGFRWEQIDQKGKI